MTTLAEILDSNVKDIDEPDSVQQLLVGLDKQALIESFKAVCSSNEQLRKRLEVSLKERLDEELKFSSSQYEVKSIQRDRGLVSTDANDSRWFDLARIVPLRLSPDERKLLLILDRTLRTAEYTDKVDVYCRSSARSETIRSEITKVGAIISGLVLAQNVALSSKLSAEMGMDNFCRKIFEIGRRYKMLNPDRMRESYGKLIYLLQDSRNIVGDKFIAKVTTVQDYLASRDDAKSILLDPLLTSAISGAPNDRQHSLLDLTRKYGNDIIAVVESFRDTADLSRQTFGPLDQLCKYLETFFDPKNETRPGFDLKLTSLAISAGREGARLSHSHAKQFQYVTQSLTLWREVHARFLQLWHYGESDLLSESSGYRLVDTGQGLNRLQGAAKVSRAMHAILAMVQEKLGGWVGSSAIHLGDHNVPNAFIFLDKYSQIPRILGPIAHCLNQLETEYHRWGPVIQEYIDRTFGGVEKAKRLILADFFRHGFNGSGADNFFDAGSCIDGRLTSAWNWCSLIEKKSFFPLFLLTGFVGFDGDQGW